MIEDDPYYFKKYVLLFTEQEKNDFEVSKKNASTQTYLEYIENYLYNADNFNNYKLDPENNYLYQFTTNLATKMPVIPLKNANAELLPVISDMFDNTKEEIENVSVIENCIELLLTDETDFDDADNVIDIAQKLMGFYVDLEREAN